MTHFLDSSHAKRISSFSSSIAWVRFLYTMTLIKKMITHLAIASIVLLMAMSARKPSVKDFPCPKVFRQALRQAESGGNDKLIYEESDGTLSIGRYQTSLTDKQVYGCPYNSMADIFNGEKQEQCLTLILAKLDKLYPDESWQLRYGRYFGTLRGPDWKEKMRPKPWGNFTKAALKFGCKL